MKNKCLLFCGLIFAFAFFIIGAKAASAASLFLSPASGSYLVGQTFNAAVLVSSPDQAMNAASSRISFPADKLEIISLAKSGSIFSLWVQEPSFSNSAGTVNFEGIVLNPGFIGASGVSQSHGKSSRDSGQNRGNYGSIWYSGRAPSFFPDPP